MTDEGTKYGTIEVRTGKEAKYSKYTVPDYTLAVDRLAAARDGTLYMVSVIGTQGTVKGLRAILNTGAATARLKLEDVRVGDGKDSGEARVVTPPEGVRYEFHPHSLGFDNFHALFLSRAPGFLPCVSDESVWRELKRPEYNTPILRSWVPEITRRLKAEGLLVPLFCYRAECALINATNDDLDGIVSAGVRSGKMKFRENAACANP